MSLFDEESRKQLKLASKVGAVGLELVLATLIGYFGGRWLDGHFDTSPWFSTIGFAIGVAAGFKGLWRTARTTDLDSH